MRSGEYSSVYGSHSACRSFQNFFWNSFCLLGERKGRQAVGTRAARLQHVGWLPTPRLTALSLAGHALLCQPRPCP